MSARPDAGRDAYGDALRGAAIIGVVAIHALDAILPAEAYQAVALYFRWCVPVFLFLTAFYGARSLLAAPACSPWAWSTARLRRLAWPYIAYTVLYLSLDMPFEGLTLTRFVTTHLAGYGWPGQYYFIIVFQLVPLVACLSRVGLTWRHTAWIWTLTLVLYATAPDLWRAFPTLAKLADRPFWYWLAYLALGVCAARLQGGKVPWTRPAWLTPRLALGLTMLAPFIIVTAGSPSGHDSPYVRPAVLLASTALLGLAHVVTQAWLPPSWLRHLGRHSLVIFCLNPLFIMLGRQLPIEWHAMTLPWMTAAVLATGFVIAVIGASLMAGKLLKLLGLSRLVA